MELRDLLGTPERTAIEKWAESRAKSVYVGEHRAICRVLGELLMYVDTRDVEIAPHLMMDGYWEMWCTMAVAREVREGARCIDVGANVGYYTLLLAHLVGPEGRVQAWEPQAGLRECLGRSVDVNGYPSRVIRIRRAASDHSDGVMRLEADEPHQLGSVRVSEPEPAAPGLDATARSRRLDAGLFAQEPVDFVKIDVEGHEARVWEGMSGIIERSPGLQVLMEFTPDDHAEPEAFLRRVQEDGFTLRRVHDDGELKPVSEGELLDGREFEMLWLKRG